MKTSRNSRLKGTKFIPGLYYNRSFLSNSERQQVLYWTSTIFPIWENRFSLHNPPPPGEVQRQLLRPVYWLGNWQFACLNYYHPPKGIKNRCVQAEPFPPILAQLVARIERLAHNMFSDHDLPPKWHLNTCLVNFYGIKTEGEKRIDTARVGEHKDFEPGPVASLSLGERAMFQFVTSNKNSQRNEVVLEQWLDDGSLQIFGGHRWKSHCFHRVQRVDDKNKTHFPFQVDNFETRRLNFTFRYVPTEHIIPYAQLPATAREDVRESMSTLAHNSRFFKQAMAKETAIYS